MKIIARVLEKYEDCDLGFEFWDLFFSAVDSLIKSFKQEGSSSEKPSSLFSCFLSMSKSRSLVVTFLCREESLVPDIFSILTVTTASEAIKSSALSFIENLLSLESDLDDDDEDVEAHPGYAYDGYYDVDAYDEKEFLDDIKNMRHFLELMIPSLDDITYLRFTYMIKPCAKLMNDVQSRSCFVP